jgi:cytochrome c oxidase cbb3-type subunit I/II
MWRAFDETGRLAYPDFVETVMRLMPMYWVRVAGGTLYIVGMLIFGYNIWKTWMARPKAYEVPVISAPRLAAEYVDPHPAPIGGGVFARFAAANWHRRWERMPLLFTVMVVVAVVIASLAEIIPTFLIRSNVPTIASVKPYTPLELAGRDLYIREGCFNCHSQMVRPLRHETERFGEYSKPGEFVYDHPFLWGSRRIGPDLARVGGKYPDLWHVRHFEEPAAVVQNSIMPTYAHLQRRPLDFDGIQARVNAMAMLGVPYGDAVNSAPAMAREQARTMAAGIEASGGPAGLGDREVIALIAYMQRLGKDIRTASATPSGAPAAGGTP